MKCALCNQIIPVARGERLPEGVLIAGTTVNSPAVHINCILDMKKQIAELASQLIDLQRNDELNKRNK